LSIVRTRAPSPLHPHLHPVTPTSNADLPAPKKKQSIEFSDPSILSSDPFTALSSWYTAALEPMCSYRSFRAFGLWKEYEATAALEAQKK
jgi:hypothetical protein